MASLRLYEHQLAFVRVRRDTDTKGAVRSEHRHTACVMGSQVSASAKITGVEYHVSKYKDLIDELRAEVSHLWIHKRDPPVHAVFPRIGSYMPTPARRIVIFSQCVCHSRIRFG